MKILYLRRDLMAFDVNSIKTVYIEEGEVNITIDTSAGTYYASSYKIPEILAGIERLISDESIYMLEV